MKKSCKRKQPWAHRRHPLAPAGSRLSFPGKQEKTGLLPTVPVAIFTSGRLWSDMNPQFIGLTIPPSRLWGAGFEPANLFAALPLSYPLNHGEGLEPPTYKAVIKCDQASSILRSTDSNTMKPHRNFHQGLSLSSSYRGGEGNRTLTPPRYFHRENIGAHFNNLFFAPPECGNN